MSYQFGHPTFGKPKRRPATVQASEPSPEKLARLAVDRAETLKPQPDEREAALRRLIEDRAAVKHPETP
jgi:hypothetical protein